MFATCTPLIQWSSQEEEGLHGQIVSAGSAISGMEQAGTRRVAESSAGWGGGEGGRQQGACGGHTTELQLRLTGGQWKPVQAAAPTSDVTQL